MSGESRAVCLNCGREHVLGCDTSAVAQALAAAALEICKQAPPDPSCEEDIAYYDGHMAAARVVRELAERYAQ